MTSDFKSVAVRPDTYDRLEEYKEDHFRSSRASFEEVVTDLLDQVEGQE